MPRLSRRQRAYMLCAPLNDDRIHDRGMRAAVFKVRKTDDFARQRGFDEAIAELAQAIQIPPQVTEWMSKGTFVATPKWSWKRTVQNPVVIAVAVAVAVIAGIFVFQLIERLTAFPGQSTAKRLLITASSAKPVLLDPLKTEAGSLGDYLFMKHRLPHYDVPAEFAEFKTIGCRVFDDEEGQTVAQTWLSEKRMQFFLFPAERDAKTGVIKHFTGWRYVDQDRWTGVVQEQNGVCFMACIRGNESDLAPYISKKE